MWQRFLLAGTAASLALMLLGCSGTGPLNQPVAGSPKLPLPSFPPAENFEPAADIHAPTYQEPVRVTADEFQPVTTNELSSEILSAAGFHRFSGNGASGIRLVENWGYIEVCGGDDYWKFEAYEGLRFGYLPAGTFATRPQTAAVCPDGSVAAFGQDFMAGSSNFTISFYAGDRSLRYEQAPGGKYAGEIGGRPAVVLAQDERAYERSWIGLAADNGVIVLDFVRMPLAEALNIARGVECEVC